MKKNIVPWNTKIGDIGESEIEARLRRISTATKIVRDVGIDFYCDLLIKEKPILPFYVQAKSSEHWDHKQGRSIDKGTIIYWLIRSYPVYIFFYDENQDICYWYSVEQNRYNLLNKIFLTKSESVYVSFSRDRIFKKNENQDFKIQLKKDYYSLMAFRGTPQFKGSGYLKSLPSLPRSEHEYSLMKENARAILYSLIQLYISQNEIDNAINLAESVSKFDRSHHTHFLWLGYLYKEKGRKELSQKNFQNAIDICNKDNKLDENIKKNWVSILEDEIKRLGNT